MPRIPLAAETLLLRVLRLLAAETLTLLRSLGSYFGLGPQRRNPTHTTTQDYRQTGRRFPPDPTSSGIETHASHTDLEEGTLAGREAARKALEEFRSSSVEMQGPSTLLPVNAPASASTSATAVETPSVNAPSPSVPASSEFANVPGSSFTTCAPSSNLAGDQSAPDMHEPAQPVNTPGEQVIPEAHA